MVGQLGDRAIEAEARLDADGEQIERVRQLRAKQLAALSRAGADHEIWGEKAHHAERDPEQKTDPAGNRAERQPEDEAADPDSCLRGEEGGRRDSMAEAGREELAADAVDVRLRMDSQHELGKPFDRRFDDAVAERLLPGSERGAELSVVGGTFHRDLAVAGVRRCGLAEKVSRAGEEEDCKQDQKHGFTP